MQEYNKAEMQNNSDNINNFIVGWQKEKLTKR